MLVWIQLIFHLHCTPKPLPKKDFQNTVNLQLVLSMVTSPYINKQRMDNPEGAGYLPIKIDGWATYQLLVQFVHCVFIFAILFYHILIISLPHNNKHLLCFYRIIFIIDIIIRYVFVTV